MEKGDQRAETEKAEGEWSDEWKKIFLGGRIHMHIYLNVFFKTSEMQGTLLRPLYADR